MATARAAAITRHFGQLFLTQVKANASGRPGPNAPTGDYRRSWGNTYQLIDGDPTSTSGTNAPQGRRLEWGFTGIDSLGRVYDQPPYPHVGPAFDRFEMPYVVAIAGILDEAA